MYREIFLDSMLFTDTLVLKKQTNCSCKAERNFVPQLYTNSPKNNAKLQTNFKKRFYVLYRFSGFVFSVFMLIAM